MEANVTHETNAKPPPLTSDQLNYLIWRYLQESGYGEAAVKLQRDWKVDAESLPFASRIKGQALISLVQKGLRYYHLQQTLDENGQAAQELNPELFFFGPGSEKASSPSIAREVKIQPNLLYRPLSPDLPTFNNGVRKHARESGPNGLSDGISTQQPVPKRSRKTAHTNNHANSNNNAERSVSLQPVQQTAANNEMGNNNQHDSAMEIDEVEGSGGSGAALAATNGHSQNYHPETLDDGSAATNGVQPDTRMIDVDAPDPHHPAALGAGGPVGAVGDPRDQAREQHIEPLPLISTLANGSNIGVQVVPAKVAQLGAATTILQAPEALSHASWHPADSSLLTLSGPSFCGLWRMPPVNSLQQPLYTSLVDPAPDTLVTAVTWQPNGSVLAIATYAGNSGRIHLFDGATLSLLTILPASQRAIMSLKWLPSGSHIVGLVESGQAPNGPSSMSLLLWDVSGGPEMNLAPHSITVPEHLLDVDCISHHLDSSIVCAAGDDVVYQCRTSNDFGIQERWQSPRTVSPASWTFVKCSRATSDNKVSIVAASAESMHLWMPVQGFFRPAVHSTPITGLEMRPPRSDSPNVLEFATSSMDGTIKAWRFTENPDLLSPLLKVTLGHLSPVMAVSYSPDGFCFAGAGYDKLRVWNADQGGYGQPLAMWDGSDSEWRGASLREDDNISNGGLSSLNGDNSSSIADHCLIWDATSKKLAFALGKQAAIINYQR